MSRPIVISSIPRTSSASRIERRKPKTLPLSLMWPDRFITSDDEDEEDEYYTEEMDLGAESDAEVEESSASESSISRSSQGPWAGFGANTDVPPRTRSWRSSSFNEKHRNARKPVGVLYVDRDCAICFETAVKPCRTLCCGGLFCMEHISDWLRSETRCPSCRKPCNLADDTLHLPGPIIRTRPHSQPPAGRSLLDDALAIVASPPPEDIHDNPPAYTPAPSHSEATLARSASMQTMAIRAAEPPNLLIEEDVMALLNHPRMKLAVSQLASRLLNAIGIIMILYVLLS